jgi:hypothetical protein
MNHDMHDDGLVHSHNWATEKAGPVMSRARHVAAQATPPAEPDHDDGLVHGHGWACSERGRMAGEAQRPSR